MTLYDTLASAKAAWEEEDPSEFGELLLTAYDQAITLGDDDTADAIADLWTTTPDDPVAVLAQMLSVLDHEDD